MVLKITNQTKDFGHISHQNINGKGNLPTDIVKSGFHREYEVFNYKAAQKAYYLQRHPEQKRSAFEILGALYIINHLSKMEEKIMEYTTMVYILVIKQT